MMSADGRIEKQINWLIAVPCLVLFAALTGYFLTQRLANAEKQLQRRGHLIVSQLAPLAEYSIFSGDFTPLETSFEQLLDDPEIVAIEIYDSRGNRLFRRADENGLAEDTRRFQALVKPSRTAVQNIGNNLPAALGKAVIYMSTQPLQQEQITIIGSGALIAALVLLFSLSGAMLYGRRLSNRIVQVANAVRKLIGGDYNIAIDASDHSELGQLARDVQSLARTLKEAERTEKQYVQALLKSVREAQEANAAKSEFLANISHELRTPMNATLGMLQILELADLPATEKEHVDLALKSTQHLLALINDILDFEKARGGRMRLEHIRVQLHELFSGIVAGFRPQAEAKSLRLEGDFDSVHDVTIFTDPTRLTQIVTNLLGNAIKFTSQGFVQFHAHITPKKDDPQMVDLTIRVKDSGPGIPEHLHNHIFEAFTQADASTTRRFGGTGLGLAITRQLTQLFNGRIDVHSHAGEGCTFTVVIPAQLATSNDEATSSPVDPTPLPKLRGKVLLAEDNPANQKVVATMLGKLGLEVEVASNGHDAFRLASLDRYDLLAVDLQMPGLDGVQLLQELRQHHGPNQNTPAVIISAAETPLSPDRTKRLGILGYIPKPVRFDRIISLVATVFSEDTQVD